MAQRGRGPVRGGVSGEGAPAVVLREWEPSDAPAVAAMLGDQHIRRWSSLPALGPEAWIAEQRAGRRGPSRAICLADDPTVLGKIALRRPGHASPATSCAAIRPDDQPAAELSYWIVPAARGLGLAGAAASRLLATITPADGIRSVVLDIETVNVASLRLAARLGAEPRLPHRTERDRSGVPRTLTVHVLALRRAC